LDILKEFLLLNFHILDHLLLQFIENCSLAFHDLDDTFGASKQMPLILLVSIRQVVVELIKDVVSLHDLVDLFLFLLDFSTLITYEVLSVGQIFNSLGSLQNFVFHEAEVGRKLVSVILCNRCDKFDVFLTNLLILSGIGGSNILAVYEEHAYLNLRWDTLE